jgi:DNA-binding transcriptional regulator PaaX
MQQSTTKKEATGGDGLLVPDARVPLSLSGALLATLSDGKSLSIGQLKRSPLIERLLKDKKENSFYTALSRLMRRQIICKRGTNYGLGVKGQYQVLRSYVLAHQRKEHERRAKDGGEVRRSWDGKWRVVVFDIPERQRSLRDFLRNTMKRLGAHELLRSFWVYPYRIPEYIEKAVDSEFYRGKAYIMTTSDIEYGPRLRKVFSLQ